MQPEKITAIIQSFLPCQFIHIEGDGHHFFAQIVSSAFENKNRLARHRMVKDGLKNYLASNELHALSITLAATPEEWRAQQES